MPIIKWSPMKDLQEMRKDMDRLFSDFFDPLPRQWRRWWPRSIESGVIVPNIDMYDRKNEVVLEAELPGVDKNDIDVSVTEDTLTLRGEIKRDEDVKDQDYYTFERSYGSFNRSISLPSVVDTEKAKASFKNGVLEIVLPKKEEAKPKEIKLDIAGLPGDVTTPPPPPKKGKSK